MSLGISINLHVRDEVTTIETHAPESQTATVKVRDEGGYNGVTLFFNDLAHAERWVRDLLGQVEVAKIEAANDQPKPEPRKWNECGVMHHGRYQCTLPADHEGDHIAHGPDDEVCATWAEPVLTEIAARGYLCGARHADGYVCTNLPGHDGDHCSASGRGRELSPCWPQAEIAASDPVPVQPAGEVVESAVDASPAMLEGHQSEECTTEQCWCW